MLNNNLTVDGTPFRFGKDADGNYGYIITDEAGADSVIPFKSCNLEDISLIGNVHISPNNTGSGHARTGIIEASECYDYGLLLIAAYADSNGTCANNTYTIDGAEILLTTRTGLPSYSNSQAIMLVLKNIIASKHTITCYNPANQSSSVNYVCNLYGI